MDDSELSKKLRDHAHPLVEGRNDWTPLLEQIGDARIVLLGEATHGTHEFYKARSEITRRLIEEKDFCAVAIEGDWPDALNIHRFITRETHGPSVLESLRDFQRFPMWMWRNTDFLQLVGWLWMHNRRETTAHQVGVFGLDIYSLFKSLDAVVAYLDQHDAETAKMARDLYSCFDFAGRDSVRYGGLIRSGMRTSCEKNAIEVATALFEENTRSDEVFFAQRNAELVRSAESYYRNLFNPFVNTWNIRDRHMASTVADTLGHMKEQGRPEKIIIWAHNSHVGDDRATEMGQRGQWNVGQLLRQRFPGETFTLGFTTYSGTVQAAKEWDHPPFLQKINRGLEGSVESLFHQVNIQNFYLDLQNPDIQSDLARERLERAIGVIYAPHSERASHYFNAKLSEQFDAVVHFDESHGVEPLDRLPTPELSEPSDVRY